MNTWDNPDAYCYPGTTVLRNFLDLTDANELAAAEKTSLVCEAFSYPHLPLPPHNLNCLLGIHRTLFGKLYPFAGKFRIHTGRMTKTRASGYAVVYCNSAYIPTQIYLVFTALAAEKYLADANPQDFAQRAACLYGEFDAHPPVLRHRQRPNLRLFFSGIAMTAGFQLDWRILAAIDLTQRELYAVRDRAVMHGDRAPLAALFSHILSSQ